MIVKSAVGAFPQIHSRKPQAKSVSSTSDLYIVYTACIATLDVFVLRL